MSKTPICSLELMSHSDLSRISHRPEAISQVFGLLPLFFALPRLSCGHTDTLSDYSCSSFWHSLLCLQNQPLNWHDTSQFFSFVPKRGSLGGEAKGAAGVCFFQLVLVCSLSLTNSPPTWVLPGAVVSPFRGWWEVCDVAQVNMVKMPTMCSETWAPPEIHGKGSWGSSEERWNEPSKFCGGKESFCSQVWAAFNHICWLRGGKNMKSILECVRLCSYWVSTSSKDQYTVAVLTLLAL